MSRWIGKILIAGALACLINSAWIPAKAELAQHLLQKAWQRTLDGERQVRPWPWADTWPIARLQTPDHGIDLIVLAGSSGRTLAFGPGHVAGSANPGEGGNSIIGGHRDTHFEFLGKLSLTDRLLLETPQSTHWLEVSDIRVVNINEVDLALQTRDSMLTLVTCYPLDAPIPGGPLRLVVTAEPVSLMAMF